MNKVNKVLGKVTCISNSSYVDEAMYNSLVSITVGSIAIETAYNNNNNYTIIQLNKC